MKKYIKATQVDGTILYRSGSVEPSAIANSDRGVFFADSPKYFYKHPYINFEKMEPYKRYMLLPNAKVWEPEKEFEEFVVNSWDYIGCLISDLEKFGLEDECDWEMDEGWGATSTDGLAIAGKELGYDATVIRGVDYHHGYFDEYAIYNPAVIKPY